MAPASASGKMAPGWKQLLPLSGQQPHGPGPAGTPDVRTLASPSVLLHSGHLGLTKAVASTLLGFIVCVALGPA